jgi:transposase
LPSGDRELLESQAQASDAASTMAKRAQIVLLAADGLNNEAIARRLGVSGVTVGSWRRRFLERGLDGLRDEPRVGRPREIGDDRVQAVIRATLETKPDGALRWSTRLMADKMGMSQSSISHIWRAAGLTPHRWGSPPPADAGRRSEGAGDHPSPSAPSEARAPRGGPLVLT